MNFDELGLSAELLEGISRLGFESPTPVQAAVIPEMLTQDRDLVALAQTGTGKTAAFGLPLLQTLDPDGKTPQALILCPTRELCMQIARDLQSFCVCLRKVRVLAVYGGADIRPQLSALSRGVDVVVATPGRMVDLLRRKSANFSQIRRVVLDEADEMLNMGFEEDLEAILSQVPAAAQTLLFSATMPRQVASIARKYMTDAKEVTIGTRNAGAENVQHEYAVVHARDRYSALKRLADFYPAMYGIVFCRTRKETQDIADRLTKDGYNAEPLHGDLTQMQRDRVMKKFRGRNLQMLVATDVAARGLDVNDLTHVINYSLPDELGGYTHRSGRTGRAGKSGVSISLIHMREHFKVRQIEKQLGCTFVQRTVPTGADICHVRLLELMERLGRTTPEQGLIDDLLPSLSQQLEGVSREELLRRFASLELQRLLEYYSKEPDLNVESISNKESRPPRKRKTAQAGGMTELVLNVGKVNGLSPKKLINLINAADRASSIDIGRINIVKMQAYVEVPQHAARGVIDSFANTHVDFGGRKVSAAVAQPGKPGGRPGKPNYAKKKRHKDAPKKRQKKS
jgi:ATP-dependent RNA helicase DeaD